jgi:hypothetical protein
MQIGQVDEDPPLGIPPRNRALSGAFSIERRAAHVAKTRLPRRIVVALWTNHAFDSLSPPLERSLHSAGWRDLQVLSVAPTILLMDCGGQRRSSLRLLPH